MSLQSGNMQAAMGKLITQDCQPARMKQRGRKFLDAVDETGTAAYQPPLQILSAKPVGRPR